MAQAMHSARPQTSQAATESSPEWIEQRPFLAAAGSRRTALSRPCSGSSGPDSPDGASRTSDIAS